MKIAFIYDKRIQLLAEDAGLPYGINLRLDSYDVSEVINIKNDYDVFILDNRTKLSHDEKRNLCLDLDKLVLLKFVDKYHI